MNTHVHTSLTPELAAEWRALWESHRDLATAFNAPEWVEAAQKAFSERDIRIVTVRTNDGQLAGICSLVKFKLYGMTAYGAPAAEFADKPTILIDWDNTLAVEHLAGELGKLGIVYLSYCRGEIMNRLSAAAPGHVVSFQDDQNAVVDFANGPFGDLSQSSRNKIRNRINKSKEPVTMHHSEHDPVRMLKSTYRVENQSTKNARGMGVLTRPQVRSFFERLALRKPELIHVSIMEVGDKPIAFSVDFLAHKIYQGSQKAYVHGYEYIQPGKYLVMKLLEYNCEKGYSGFDFGRGYDNFKLQFTKNVRPVYTVVLANKMVGQYISRIRTIRHHVYHTIVSQKPLYKAFKTVRNAFHA